MHRSWFQRVALPTATLLLAGSSFAAQGPQQRPQLYVITNVRLNDATDAPRHHIVLRGGRVESVLDAAAALPPGARIVEAKDLIASPAFIDAFTAAGCVTPTPKVDRDIPANTRADVQIDMRDANRKGVAPGFRAVDVLDLAKDKAKAYREAGFGALLAAPQGQLLGGTSVLACTRDAAMRDTVIAPEVFAHAAFRASGAGYPATPMGFMAQLRQFFLDAQRQVELEKRFAAGRPGQRPPFDSDLGAATSVLAHKRRVVCEAQSARAIERWIKLADEFGFDIAIAGGRDAWKLAGVLAARGIPVILTLDWGEEVKDPHEKEKQAAKKKAEAEKKPKEVPEKPVPLAAAAPAPDASAPATQSAPPESTPSPGERSQDPAQKPPEQKPSEQKPPEQKEAPTPIEEKKSDEAKPDETKPDDKKPDDKAAKPKEWEYEEPLPVREERRRLWEEGRDCAMKLRTAGVAYTFGSAEASPADLVKRVRTLVENGLPTDEALALLTRGAAEVLGQGSHLGQIAPGFDASIALWTAAPLSKDAKLAWLFVDGFPYEFEIKKDEGEGGKPDEGVNATGTWELTIEGRGGARPATVVIKMSDDGDVTGTYTSKNPRDESEVTADVKGHVSGKTLTLRTTLNFGNRESELVIKGELAGDEITGESTTRGGFGEFTSTMKGTRKPKRAQESLDLEVDDHPEHSCKEMEGGAQR
jgi:imidazolonepropionase-like amidohydrolase